MLDVIITPPPGVLETNYREFGLDVRSFREPLKRSVQQVMAPSFAKNFDLGGRPSWEPLSPETVKKKGNATILVDTGKLKSKVGQLNNWQITQEEAQMMQVTGVPYDRVHQFGGGIVPARPFALVQEEDVDAIEEVFAEWLHERAVARGLDDEGILESVFGE